MLVKQAMPQGVEARPNPAKTHVVSMGADKTGGFSLDIPTRFGSPKNSIDVFFHSARNTAPTEPGNEYPD